MASDERKFYTLREAAEYLTRAGLRSSYLSVYSLMRRGRLRAVRFSRWFYISVDELNRFIDELKAVRLEEERAPEKGEGDEQCDG